MSASCTVGFRVKSGWAAAVLVAGPKKAPTVLDSRMIELSDPSVPDSRQPYHAGFGTEQTDTAKVERLVRGIEQFSRRAIAALLAEYREQHRMKSAGVVVASLTDPATIANQHMRAHASEGRLFRTVLVDGLERCGVTVRIVLERDVYQSLGRALRRPPASLKTKVTALGEGVGRWRAEQKVAAAAAWRALVGSWRAEA
ncbi:MAG TPA: hypothetical protein VGQ48_13810 [Gemmatimonadales bacterium]|jgi:hypothetical protein|nr:hypothetical protein [Gemmatimonadales bacterium]